MIRTRTVETAAGSPYREVTIDDPGTANALRPDDLEALERAIKEATEPIVYLRGAGDTFCSGANLDTVASLTDPAAFARHGQRVAHSIEDATEVVIAGIHGAARGGGVEIALACDIRVATPDATFAESGVRLGLFGAWGGTHRLPRLLRKGDALEFALSGREVGALEARRLGLVSRVEPQPETVINELAAVPADTLRTVKEQLRGHIRRAGGRIQRAERAERAAFAKLHRTHIGQERTG